MGVIFRNKKYCAIGFVADSARLDVQDQSKDGVKSDGLIGFKTRVEGHCMYHDGDCTNPVTQTWAKDPGLKAQWKKSRISDGDIMAATIDLDARTISYSQNGNCLGIGQRNIKVTAYRPAVSLYNPGATATLIPNCNANAL